MYYIYFEDKSIIFTDHLDQSYDLLVELAEGEKISITKMLENLENNKYLCVKANDPKAAFEDFCAQFTFVEAAGGLVGNEAGELLMIFRRGKWDLPKGHIEQGENPEQAAIREVREETGLCSVAVENLITTTYHFYFLNERWEMKRTWWYSMSTASKNVVPQTEEGITEVVWVSSKQIRGFMQKTYSSIAEVLNKSGKICKTIS